MTSKAEKQEIFVCGKLKIFTLLPPYQRRWRRQYTTTGGHVFTRVVIQNIYAAAAATSSSVCVNKREQTCARSNFRQFVATGYATSGRRACVECVWHVCGAILLIKELKLNLIY